MLHNNLDILLIFETKIYSPIATAQFQIEGFVAYGLDRDFNVGDILLLYQGRHIIQTAEFWYVYYLLVCTYNPNKNVVLNILKKINTNLDHYFSKYDNFFRLDDLNSQPTESVVRDFCEICKNSVEENTCYKNLLKSSCFDPIIRNRSKRFQSSVAVRTGLSGFQKMSLTLVKVFYA